MSVNMTELDSLDSLKSETDQAKAATAPVVEAVTGVQEWAKSLPERAAANGWGTKGLDEAFAALAELVPQGDWGPFLDGLTRIEHEINQARALGEIAAAQGARGSVDAFKSA